ncbi:RcnB family protein [Erwinia sp. S38]|uniref:RcnB family protein n=1 Tax=Erwinia sp. S38 TaxID=2769338 RepID=UPI00190D6E93|nr:RcnB family protein [Erwinia sp. S38]MBK0001501.1 RcnB family protein [Erwinia sp. S38]
MKKTTLALVLSVLTASSFFSTFSHADGPGNGPERQWHQQGGGQPDRGDRHDRNDRGGPDRHDNRGPDRDNHERFRPAERDRFAWNGHDFRRGQPLPPHFRGNDYRVDDWHRRGLYEPPRGAYWGYIDGNYVLIAAATGVITSIILGSALGHY